MKFKKIFDKKHSKYGHIDRFNLLNFNFSILNIFDLTFRLLSHSVIFDKFEFIYIGLSIFKFCFHLHFDVNWDEEPEAGYRKISKNELDSCNLDYVALGHFHDTLEVKSKVKCFYSGSPEPLSFKNKKDCCVLLVSHTKGNTLVKSVKTNIRSFETIELDCTDFESESELRKILEKNKGESKVLRLILKGSPSLELNLDIETLEKEFESKYFLLKIVDNIHLPENLTEDETIRGHFIRLIKSEIKREKDPEKKKRLENALRLGVSYLDKKM